MSIEKVHKVISEVQDRMLFDSSAYKPINEVINMENDVYVKTYMRIDGQVGMEVSLTKPIEYIKLEFKTNKRLKEGLNPFGIKMTCPVCNKTMDQANFIRWKHGNQCAR